MTTIQGIYLLVYLLLMATLYAWASRGMMHGWGQRFDERKSRRIVSAGVGTLLIPYFDRLVSRGSILYVPIGDGWYMAHHEANSRKALARWLARGASIHVIITSRDVFGHRLWLELKKAYPDNFHVHFLDRERVPGDSEMRAPLEALDTFHAVALTAPEGSPAYPGVLWLEANHPPRSKLAHGIEYVAPNDAAGDDRLPRYIDLYRRLLRAPFASELDAEAQREISAAA